MATTRLSVTGLETKCIENEKLIGDKIAQLEAEYNELQKIYQKSPGEVGSRLNDLFERIEQLRGRRTTIKQLFVVVQAAEQWGSGFLDVGPEECAVLLHPVI